MTDRVYTAEDIESVFADRKDTAIGRTKEFSVLAPIVELDGEACLIYEVRANDLGRQPGEICFPGGEMEQGETPRACAIRETCEELLIPEHDIKLIGKAGCLYPFTGISMHCFVGRISPGVYRTIRPSEREVSEVFTIPVSWLAEHAPRIVPIPVRLDVPADFPYEDTGFGSDYPWMTGRHPVPVYPEYEGRKLWGLTGILTDHIIRVIKGEL